MISVQSAINRAQRDLKISSAVNVLLVLAALTSLLVVPFLNLPIDSLVALTIVGAMYGLLGLRSMRSSRLAANSSTLIAAGQFDAAEQHIDGALRAFSIFRAVKLISLHHLAALRYAQNRFQDAAAICQALLNQQSVSRQSMGRATRLILADSLLELNDVAGAGRCVAELYSQRLSLGEALSLLLVQLDYESRLGAWQSMMTAAPAKVRLAELMPTPKSARTQALLALAARHVGRHDWETWLRRRVELLIDPQELVIRRPLLRELWLT